MRSGTTRRAQRRGGGVHDDGSAPGKSRASNGASPHGSPSSCIGRGGPSSTSTRTVRPRPNHNRRAPFDGRTRARRTRSDSAPRPRPEAPRRRASRRPARCRAEPQKRPGTSSRSSRPTPWPPAAHGPLRQPSRGGATRDVGKRRERLHHVRRIFQRCFSVAAVPPSVGRRNRASTHGEIVRTVRRLDGTEVDRRGAAGQDHARRRRRVAWQRRFPASRFPVRRTSRAGCRSSRRPRRSPSPCRRPVADERVEALAWASRAKRRASPAEPWRAPRPSSRRGAAYPAVVTARASVRAARVGDQQCASHGQ